MQCSQIRLLCRLSIHHWRHFVTNNSAMGTVNKDTDYRDGEAPESADFANYFCTYAYLYHQVLNPVSRITKIGRF